MRMFVAAFPRTSRVRRLAEADMARKRFPCSIPDSPTRATTSVRGMFWPNRAAGGTAKIIIGGRNKCWILMIPTPILKVQPRLVVAAVSVLPPVVFWRVGSLRATE